MEEKTHWRLLKGNRYLEVLNTVMLRDTGYDKYLRRSIKGDATRKIRCVNFDRDYVIKFISLKLVKPLRSLGLTEIHKLVNEAYLELEKEQNKKKPNQNVK